VAFVPAREHLGRDHSAASFAVQPVTLFPVGTLFFVRVNLVLVRLWARVQLSVFGRRSSDPLMIGQPERAIGRRFGACLTGKLRHVATYAENTPASGGECSEAS
jgi:hypothetical protein